MVVTTSSNKKYFQAISPSEDLQLGACAAILNIPVTHRQDMVCAHTSYLSFFLHMQNFWRIEFTPKYTVNYCVLLCITVYLSR